MYKVMGLFLAIIAVWAVIWMGIAYLIQPYIGEQLTTVIGTLLGLCVGALSMIECLDYGWYKGWMKL